MDCQTVQLLIRSSYHRPLETHEQAKVDQHLLTCPLCAEELRSDKALEALLSYELAQVQPPADFTAAVMSRLPASIPARRRRFGRVAALAAAAALLVLALGLSGLFAHQPESLALPLAQQPAESGDPALSQPELIIAEAQPDPETEAPLPSVFPPVSPQPQDDPPAPAPGPYTHGVNLPPVAINSEAHGEYSLITLAYYDSCDALNPQVSAGLVSYYIQVEGACYEYQVPADGGQQPQLTGETASLPGASGYGAAVDGAIQAASSLGDVARLQPEGLFLQAGDAWRQVGDIGGGALLSWSPDGSKVAFSSSDGTLCLYYPAENITLTVIGNISSLCWNNANSLILAARNPATGYVEIYRALVP